MKEALVVILFVMLLCPAKSVAYDAKTYPASMGVRWDGSYPVPELSFSAIANPSTTNWLKVDLPIIHDSVDTLLYCGQFSSGWVKLVDRNSAQNIKVTLHSRQRSGCSWTGWASAAQYTSGNNCNVQTLIFGALGASCPSIYYYSVEIPPVSNNLKSYVISYYVVEDN